MRLETYLRRQGLTVYDFAEDSGFSVYAIRKWLAGVRTPRDQNKIDIARITRGKVSPQDWIRQLKSRG